MDPFHLPGPPHFTWTTTHEPVGEVSSGDVVSFDLIDVTNGQLSASSTTSDLLTLDLEQLYPLAGPILVRDAEPGDVVEVEMLDLRSGDWGFTAVLPGMGLLPDDFPDAHLHLWDLRDGTVADLLGVAHVPIRPFPGTVGVCPDTREPWDVLPPGNFGGNIDCRDLVAGSRLFLPVQVAGARLAIGDPHAAQGDGEVCLTAIEAPLSGAARISLHKGRSIGAPQMDVTAALRPGLEDRGYYVTMGIAADLMQAARDAVRAMIDHLGHTYGLDPLDGYVLCSVAVDLKISELVDAPRWVVSAYLPKGIMR
jgi:acetamidase/formamidase